MKLPVLVLTILICLLPFKVMPGVPEAKLDLNELAPVGKTRLDEVLIRTGTSLKHFDTVFISPPHVSFRKNWQRDQNRRDPNRVDDEDMDRIRQTVSEQVMEILETEFGKRGFSLVAAPTPGALVVEAKVAELNVIAPDTVSANRVETYSEYAGSMTLEVLIRDGDRVVLWSRDQQRDFQRGYLEWRTRVTNNRDSRRLIHSWARDLFKTLDSA